MKKIFILICFVAICNFFLTAQSGWEWQNLHPQGNTLFDIHFTDVNTGYAVGNAGTILKTTNAGVSWIVSPVSSLKNLNAIHFTDANTAFVAGDYGAILKTTNSGTSWSTLTSGTNMNLYSVYFTKPSTGYAVGYYTSIRKTTDGGNTWSSQNLGLTKNLYSIFFTSVDTGYTVGSSGIIYKTINGGLNWIAQSSGTTYKLNSIYFINKNTGYIVGDGGMVLKTTNAGINWTILPSGITDALSKIYFTDANTAYVVGGYISTGGLIYKSINACVSWTEQTTGSEDGLESIYFTDSLIGYSVGWNGSMLKTTDGGLSWVIQSSGNKFGVLNSVYFTNVNTGYCAGANGRILKTSNGGINWVEIPGSGFTDLYSIYFTDVVTGYIVGSFASQAKILKTTNAGNTWFVQTFAYIKLRSVFFTDSNTGYASGGRNILKTTDAGTNWYVQYSYSNVNSDIASIQFINENTGIAVGYPGIFLKTTDAGTNWVVQSITTDNTVLSDIFFTSIDVGYIIGQDNNSNGLIYKTTNGGANWTFQTTTDNSALGSSHLLSVTFTNENTGFITGNDNGLQSAKIFKTTDAGLNWVLKKSNSFQTLNSIFFTDENTGIAVGGSNFSAYDVGAILKTYTGGEYISTSYDTLKIKIFQNTNSNNSCSDATSSFYINTIFSGSAYSEGDNLNFHLWFGDGSDTVFTETAQHIPIMIASSLNHTYQSSGIFSITCKVTAPDGRADSATINNLIINPSFTVNNPVTLCQGQNYVLNGHTYTTTGIFKDTLYTINGCDSIIVTNLIINSSYLSNNQISICPGQNYIFNGHTYSTNGVYTDTLFSVYGCDSLILTNLTVSPEYLMNNFISICPEQSYIINNHIYSIAGIYNDTLQSIHGCDSIVITNLSISPVYVITNPVSICEGQNFIINNHTYTTQGIYIDTLQTFNSCDSIITTNLIVNTLPNAGINVTDTTCTFFSQFNLFYSLIGNPDINGTWNDDDNTGALIDSIFNPSIVNTGIYHFTYTVFGTPPCNDAQSTVSVVVDICESINEINNSGIYIYPNPTNGKIYIKSENLIQVKVYNIIGEQIFSGNTNTCKSISLKQKGVYLFELSTDKNRIYKKVIVQ